MTPSATTSFSKATAGGRELAEKQNRGSGHKWVVAAFCAVGVGVLTLAVPAVLAQAFEWVGIWRGAGQPFATVVAGLAALTAGALALHNGEQQRRSGEQDAAALEKAFNTKTIRQLGSNKFFAVAAALVTLEEAG
jgi:hypothetical protein